MTTPEYLHARLTNSEATRSEARRFTTHLASLVATKTADGLIDPKLVLSWVLNALSAPGFLIGALVPVREAGALLPQLGLARWIQASARRKIFWAAGSAIQGLAALSIAAAALFLEGAMAGWAIVISLAVLACGRAACSASHKDVLARTVAKGTRGTVSGSAGTVSAVLVATFAVLLGLGIIPRTVSAISLAIAAAGGLWLLAALVFAGLDEPEADVEDTGPLLDGLLRPLVEDSELRTYIAARALLIPTALAPPFLVMLSSGTGDGGLANLGLLMIASASAAIASSYIWGRLSDRSSRQTLVVAGALAAGTLGGAAALGFTTGGLGGAMLSAAFIFAAQIAYEGARAGRKTHLTDMDADGQKATYTALSNSMIGVLLLAGGGFGVLADMAGPELVLAVFAVLSLAGAAIALCLSEVQRDG